MPPLDLVKSLMEEFIKDNKLVIIAEPKTIYFDLPVDVDNNLEVSNWFYHKIQWIFSWTYNKKNSWLLSCPNMSVEMILMNT